MKIYEIGTGYTPIPAQMGAATEIVVEELTKALGKQGHDVSILDIAADERKPNSLPIIEVPVPAAFKGTDVKLGIVHKLKRVIYSINLAKKLQKIIKENTGELVLHFHNQYNLFFFLKLTSRALRKKVKIAYTVHSYIWPGEWNEIKSTIKKRYFQEIYCVRHADFVLVLNDKTAEHFVKHLGVSKNKIYKVANGVNTDIYSILSEEEKSSFKRSLGLEDKKIIFQVGSVCERKNQLGAVEMLASYLKEHGEVVYMYAGGIIDEEYKESLESFAKQNHISDQVMYTGELCPGEQLNKYYNIANLTVFPSKIESFGLVIIESLSSGTPVVLGDTPLFDLSSGYDIYSNEDEFIDYVKQNIDGQNRGEKNRIEVVEKYSWDAVARQYYTVFLEEKN